MEIKAKTKHTRMSPRKVRLVADLIRGMEVNKAKSQLKFMKKLATQPIDKLIDSAIANAEHNFDLDKDNLFIKEIRVDEGKTLHRWMPRAYGRATPIRKRSSHINLTLAEIKESGEKKAKKQKLKVPLKLKTKPKQDDGLEAKKSQEEKKEEITEKEEEGQVKKIIDPRREAKGGHSKVEGHSKDKGFVSRVFRRKSG